MSESPQSPAYEIAVRTDPGRDPDKQVNEDAAVYKETTHGLLAVVCDGMGGHAGGKEASELAIATIVEIVEAAPPATTPRAALQRAIEEANARVWSMPTAEAGYRPGSTVVAVLVHAGGAEVAHVGDSRLYLVHAGAISQVTKDHSMVQQLVDHNVIRAEDAAKHPDANKILRALGIAKEVEVELRPEPIAYAAGDVFVLCSDGLSDLVEPAEILQIAGTHPPAQAVGQLVDLANARGGHDNITAMVLRMKSSATRDHLTIVKTVPFTAAPVPPVDPSSGPTGTVVSAPLGAPAAARPAEAAGGATGTAVAPPALAAAPAVAPPTPPAPPSSRISSSRGPRTPMLALGIVLAVIAVAIVIAVAYLGTRPTHRSVKVFDDDDAAAAQPTSYPDDDAGPEPEISPAPPLSATEQRRVPFLRRFDGGAAFDPCVSARRARERDASAAVINKLEEKCRASGGAP
jgi:serine/threonine protein phosphatase PrpC